MPQTSALLDLAGIGQRAVAYRFDLLNNQDRLIGELHPVSGEGTPTITHDTSRAIVRDVSPLNLSPVDAAAVNPLTDRVRPVMLLEDGSEHPLGIYLFGDASTPMWSYGEALSSTLVDKGLILNQAIEKSVGVEAGADVRAVAVQLLADVGIVAVVDAPVVWAVGAPMVWPGGTLRWQVLADLATNAGWEPPWFDHLGVCRLQRLVDPEAVEPAVVYDRNMYAESMVVTNNLLRAVNRTIAISSDSTQQAFVGIYDVPAGAPHSFYARGFRVTEVFNVQGIGSQAAVDASARTLALSTGAHRATETYVQHLSFQGAPDPRHDGYTVVTAVGRRWMESSWSLPLTPHGPMSHMVRSSDDCGCA